MIIVFLESDFLRVTMQINFEKKFTYWLANTEFFSKEMSAYSVKITVKDKDDRPDPEGAKEIHVFLDNTDKYWDIAVNKLIELHSGVPSCELLGSIENPIYLYAPAIVGGECYDLMVLVSLNSKDVSPQSWFFCFSNQKLIFSDKITE